MAVWQQPPPSPLVMQDAAAVDVFAMTAFDEQRAARADERAAAKASEQGAWLAEEVNDIRERAAKEKAEDAELGFSGPAC